ncbi:MAG: hypothetical protein GY870_16345 [archaeon]|nr:hypothetical protein [archaeon]
MIKINKNKLYSWSFSILLVLTFTIGTTALVINNISSSNDDIVVPDTIDFASIKTSEDLGNAYGTQFKDLIQENVKNYWNKVTEMGYSRNYVLSLLKEQEKSLINNAPHILEEYKAMAKASHVSYYDILALNLGEDYDLQSRMEKEECTSWIATGTSTLNNETLHHKNCDSTYITHTTIKINQTDKYAFTAVIDVASMDVRSGINEHGLSVSNNYVFIPQLNPVGISTNTYLRLLLEECKTVQEAYDYLNTHTRQEGAIFIVGDPNRGIIVEATPSTMTSFEESLIENNIGCRANHFVKLANLPGLKTSTQRYNLGTEFLTERNGTLTVLDYNELSRKHLDYTNPNKIGITDHSEANRSICYYHTVFGTTFQINRTKPLELSTMWTAMGVPCSSMYTPIQLYSSDVYDVFENGSAWDVAKQVALNNLGPLDSLTPYLQEYEALLISETELMKDNALFELNNGNVTGATEIVTDFELEKSELIYNEMKNLARSKFWNDSFYYTSGIQSIHPNITINDNIGHNITLETGETEGIFSSIPIAALFNYKSGAIFYANHSIPIWANVTYKVVDSSTGELLLSINSTEASEGFNLSVLGQIENITIVAYLNTTQLGENPTIFNWGIVGLQELPGIIDGDQSLGTIELLVYGMIGFVLFSLVLMTFVLKIQRTLKIKNEVDEEKRIQYAKVIPLLFAGIIDYTMIFILGTAAITAEMSFVSIFSIQLPFLISMTGGISTLFLVKILYFWILESKSGQTIGKYFLNLKTVDNSSLEEAKSKNYALKAILWSIPDLILGVMKNFVGSNKDRKKSQTFSKTTVIKIEKEIRYFILPLIGGIIILISFLNPAGQIFDAIDFNIWMIGVVISSDFIDGYGGVSLIADPINLTTSILCSIVIIICALATIKLSNDIRKGKEFRDVIVKLLGLGISILILTMIWQQVMGINFEIITSGPNLDYTFWETLNQGFGIYGLYIGSSMILLSVILKKSSKFLK